MKKSNDQSYYIRSRTSFERISIPLAFIITVIAVVIGILLFFKIFESITLRDLTNNMVPVIVGGIWGLAMTLEDCDIGYCFDEFRKRTVH